MKNLLIYVNPNDKKFSPEHEDLTKIQIDNSLGLGWKVEDLLLVTNFDYEYRGVKATIVDDYSVFDQNRSTKIPAINQLFRDGVIQDNEIYWFHDHDAFQLIPFEVELKKDAGFTNHGWSRKWNAGSFFFKKSAKDIFLWIWEYMNKRGTNEQDALTFMWGENINQINERSELVNITYNIGIYYIESNLRRAQLPVKVAHFHPHKKRHLDLFKEMLAPQLKVIFSKYGLLEMPPSDVAADLKNLKTRKYHKVWEPFMNKYECDRVCELGVYKGEHFLEMIAHGPTVAVAVDSWIDDGVASRNDGHYTKEQLDEQYEYFKNLMQNNPSVQIIKDYTFHAVRNFPDNYFDFVYIDADHSVEGCWRDLQDWYPKVKPGKFLVGHDYRRKFGVVEAVNRFVEENNLELIIVSPSTWAIIKK